MRLIDLPDSDGETFAPRRIPLTDDAVEEFEQFRHFLHANKQSLDGREREWWSKGGAHVLRLAGTLCFMNWAMRDEGGEPEAIGTDSIATAAHLWREYFWPHARAALRQVGTDERHRDARRVLRWLRATGKEEIALKDVRRDALAHRLDAEQTAALLERLEATGWLAKTTAPREPGKAGRSLHRWLVTPALFAMQELQELQE